MAEKLTKAEQRWRWLARRVWGGTYTGWSSGPGMGKGDRTIFARKKKAGHIEESEWGQFRLTDAGRQALQGER
ncbi:MAG: hypothetical protein DI537_20415 [Stutzerimonas stutzeri]|nr:MAG: hypothetical protein DI537_20415 [Stutzerimonas stutzeri]